MHPDQTRKGRISVKPETEQKLSGHTIAEDNPIVLRLATSKEEIIQSQKLRYKIFYEEFGSIPSEDIAREKREFDVYDDYADHLIVLDESRDPALGQIVGTYRLFRKERLPENLPFYTGHEFDITPLLTCDARLLELGRSCVLPEYRTKYAMQRLWQGIAEYLSEHQIDLMFGCACLQGTDPLAVSDQLAYLKHYHLAPDELRPCATPDCTDQITLKPKDAIDPKRVFASLPPLVKGYLRLGAYVGEGAYIDHNFNSIDVCIVLPTHKVTSKYARHYERELQKGIVTNSLFAQKYQTTDK